MELKDLKEMLVKGSKIPLPLILKPADSEFLVKEYISTIAKNLGLKCLYIENINEMVNITSSMFYENDLLFIYKPEKDIVLHYKDVEKYSIIIIYDNLPKDNDIDAVEFCKLENWMIEDYAKALLPGLTIQETTWLCKICNYNVDRIYLEAGKINIFNKETQPDIFAMINNENGYCDLNDLNIFNLTNAIIKKDILSIKKIIKDIDYIDIEGTGLITILLKQLLNIIKVQMSPSSSCDSLGFSNKQLYAIKYNCNIYSNDELIKIYKFLNDFDYKIKGGLIDLDNRDIVQYILNYIFEH